MALPIFAAAGATIAKFGIVKSLGIASMGLDLASKTKDLIFGDKSKSDSSKIIAYSNEITRLNEEIQRLEKEKFAMSYELLVSMHQTLVFRCAIVDLEKGLSGSFFTRLKNLFVKPKGFVGDKLNEFIANNAELEKILQSDFESIKAKAKELDIELPQEDNLMGDLA
ncbi:hypothetical protein ACWIUD_08555 [Helicobacter sp. 23-1044]